MKQLQAYALVLGLAMLWAPCVGAMSFSADRVCVPQNACEQGLLGTGPIDDKTATAFDEAIAAHPEARVIVLTSKGGSLVGGLRLGLQIRRFQLDTYVNDDCFSACAYAFLGGVARTVAPEGRIGVHQFKAGNRDLDVANAQKITAVLGAYIDRMGIDRRLLDTALLTPTSQVVIFTPEQLKALKADNRGNVFLPWRFETTAQGQKLALWNGLYPDPDVRRTLTIGVAKLSDTPRLFVIVRSSVSMNAFSGVFPLTLQIKQQEWVLSPLSDWTPISKGRQTNYALPTGAVMAMQSTDAKEIRIIARWPELIQGDRLTTIRIGTDQLPQVLRNLNLSH